MYLGTKVNLNASFIPSTFDSEEFDTFTDYKDVEKKVIEIKRGDVIKSSENDTLLKVIEYLNKELDTDKVKAYGLIKFIESNIKGHNLLTDTEASLLVTVFIYSKPILKPKKVSKSKTETK